MLIIRIIGTNVTVVQKNYIKFLRKRILVILGGSKSTKTFHFCIFPIFT